MSGQGSGGNVIAAICNFFIPGLGQFVQGRILAAIIFFVLVSCQLFSSRHWNFILYGFIWTYFSHMGHN